jgi:hypothetical protein
LPSGTIVATDERQGLFLLQYEPDAGLISGTVRSSKGGPIEGAVVDYRNLDNTFVTRADGAFQIPVFPGPSHTIVASIWPFATDSITVNVAANDTVIAPIELTPLPTVSLTITVLDDGTEIPLENADVELAGFPFAGVSDAQGEVEFATVPIGTYTAHIRRHGYHIRDVPIVLREGIPRAIPARLHPAEVYVDFTDASGWTVSNTASAGWWIIDASVADSAFGRASQPGQDHTIGIDNVCAYTDSLEDVDNGATRLISRVYDLSGLAEPSLFYYRWYFAWLTTSLPSSDTFLVRMSDDGGTSFPFVIERTTSPPVSLWEPVEVDLTQFTTDFTSVQFLFLARDDGLDEAVEAALDDFTIFDASLGPIAVPNRTGLPAHLALTPGQPNPFRNQTRIRFTVPQKVPVDLSVFDVRGALVARLLNEEVAAGDHTIDWNGRTGAGRAAAAGVYFLRLETPDGARTGRIVRLR